jgi:hypothetical protein
MVANPITFGEIAAWARLTGREPSPWEIGVLRQMDQAALEAMAKKLAKKSDPKQPARREIDPDDWQALDRVLDRMG